MKKKLFNEKTDWQRGLTTNVIYYMLSTKALPYIQRETVFFTEYQKQISVLIKGSVRGDVSVIYPYNPNRLPEYIKQYITELDGVHSSK